jgi:hypothetical protein
MAKSSVRLNDQLLPMISWVFSSLTFQQEVSYHSGILFERSLSTALGSKCVRITMALRGLGLLFCGAQRARQAALVSFGGLQGPVRTSPMSSWSAW